MCVFAIQILSNDISGNQEREPLRDMEVFSMNFFSVSCSVVYNILNRRFLINCIDLIIVGFDE